MKQDISNDSRMFVMFVELVFQDGIFCNVVSRVLSNFCEGSKDIMLLFIERGFYGQLFLNVSMIDIINQFGEYFCNIGKIL